MLLGKVHQARGAAIALVVRQLLTVLEHPGARRSVHGAARLVGEKTPGVERLTSKNGEEE
jgi:hypothetical protein